MNFVDIPETAPDASRRTGANGSRDGEMVDRATVSKGGDAADILPDGTLERLIGSLEGVGRDDPPRTLVIRGEFAQLQRELEGKIERFDRTCAVCYEDAELVIYRLDRQKDYEYILDYCEIDDARLRRTMVELMRAIAADRAGDVPPYPLVVRKPQMFRSGERHVLFRLERFARDAPVVSRWIRQFLDHSRLGSRTE